ncbi:hypothetical protein JYU14_02945, partial [Simkania negevensis]|nr:hypothetical protein [Simkania negevensis]
GVGGAEGAQGKPVEQQAAEVKNIRNEELQLYQKLITITKNTKTTHALLKALKKEISQEQTTLAHKLQGLLRKLKQGTALLKPSKGTKSLEKGSYKILKGLQNSLKELQTDLSARLKGKDSTITPKEQNIVLAQLKATQKSIEAAMRTTAQGGSTAVSPSLSNDFTMLTGALTSALGVGSKKSVGATEDTKGKKKAGESIQELLNTIMLEQVMGEIGYNISAFTTATKITTKGLSMANHIQSLLLDLKSKMPSAYLTSGGGLKSGLSIRKEARNWFQRHDGNLIGLISRSLLPYIKSMEAKFSDPSLFGKGFNSKIGNILTWLSAIQNCNPASFASLWSGSKGFKEMKDNIGNAVTTVTAQVNGNQTKLKMYMVNLQQVYQMTASIQSSFQNASMQILGNVRGA